jgi:hypothetical protein
MKTGSRLYLIWASRFSIKSTKTNHDPQNIFTHFYLSSQLKGRIYDPAYYFDKDNKNRDNDLDLLLLTQGWRRYVWNEQELEENSKNSQQVISDGVKGKVTATKNIKKAPKGNQVLSIFNPAKGDDKYILLADSTGNIEVAPAHLKLGQGGYVYFKPTRDETHEYKITMESPFDTIKNILNFKEIICSNSVKEEKESTARPFIPGPNILELGEVTVTGKHNQQFRDKYLGYLDSLAKVHYDPGDYVCISSILNCPIHKNDPENTKPLEGINYKQYVGFEWRKQPGGAYTFTGWENIEYHYPVFTEEFLLKVNNLSRIKGYYIEREFYQPYYDKTDSLNMIPDYRNTLLWVPTVLTDRNGEAELEFFCSDIYTGFVGIIEGVSGDGKLGSDSFEFKVLKTKPFEWEK